MKSERILSIENTFYTLQTCHIHLCASLSGNKKKTEEGEEEDEGSTCSPLAQATTDPWAPQTEMDCDRLRETEMQYIYVYIHIYEESERERERARERYTHRENRGATETHLCGAVDEADWSKLLFPLPNPPAPPAACCSRAILRSLRSQYVVQHRLCIFRCFIFVVLV